MFVLLKFGIMSLYEDFTQAGIEVDILWQLSEEELREMKINVGGKKKYRTAREQWEKGWFLNNPVFLAP